MTVERNKDNELEIECDSCGEVDALDTKRFAEVQEKKREIGWESRQVSGNWLDLCPSCLEKINDL